MRNPDRPTPLDRFLRLFTDVRPGESGTALLLLVNAFLILSAYSILKVVREAFITSAGGVNVRVVSSAGAAILLLGAVPLYGLIASRVPRRRLINLVTAFFALCLSGFYLLRVLGVTVGIAFFIWLAMFSVMVVSQFWSFANDVYTSDEGKRLFPLVAFGSASGAVTGAWVSGQLAPVIGVSEVLLVSAGLLVLGAVITNVIDHRERRRTEATVPDVKATGSVPAATSQLRMATGKLSLSTAEYKRESGFFQAVKPGEPLPPEEPEQPGSTGGAFQLVLRSRYLLLIALLVLLLNWVNTTGENILYAFVQSQARSAQGQGLDPELVTEKFYANYQTVVNLVTMILQLFVVSRAIKYAGVGGALLVLPLIAFTGYVLIAFAPVIAAIRWVKTAENSTDYSLNNTARHALFLPTTREEKYKGKQAVDSFCQRAGDVLAAGTWFAGTALVGLAFNQLVFVNLALVSVWLVVAVLIGRRYRRLVAVTEARAA
jgi:AAA family ATP:ADP antiporter